jgi:hypothetical protein
LDDSIVAEQDLIIKSEGLQGIIKKTPVPVYLNTSQIAAKNGLEITESQITEAGFDIKNEIPICSINLVGELENIDGNNFSVEADLKHTFPQGDAICQISVIGIICTNGYFQIPFSIKGCVSDLRVMIPGKMISAKENDLTALGTDFSDYVHAKVSVADGHFEVCVGDNPPFQDSLTVNPGKVVGIQFFFKGSGAVKSFQLKSGNQQYEMCDFLP